MKYKCTKCGKEFKAKMDVVCPDCGAVSGFKVIYEYKIAGAAAGKK